MIHDEEWLGGRIGKLLERWILAEGIGKGVSNLPALSLNRSSKNKRMQRQMIMTS